MFSCFFYIPSKKYFANSNKFCIFAFYYYTNEKQNPHHIDVVGHPSGMGTT